MLEGLQPATVANGIFIVPWKTQKNSQDPYFLYKLTTIFAKTQSYALILNKIKFLHTKLNNCP